MKISTEIKTKEGSLDVDATYPAITFDQEANLVPTLDEVKAIIAQGDFPKNYIDLVPFKLLHELTHEELGALVESNNNHETSYDYLVMPSSLVQTGLPEKPRSHEGPFLRQIRKNGYHTVEFVCTSKEHELASGFKARALLAYINQQALLTDNRHVYLGQDLKSFVEEGIGAKAGSGDRGGSKMYKFHLANLCHLFIDVRGGLQKRDAAGGNETEYGGSMDIISSHSIWGTDDYMKGEGAWVMLSLDYFEHLKSHAVPLPTDAFKVLLKKQSSLQFDIYLWARYRQYRLSKSKTRTVSISWRELHQHLGPNYKSLHDFKKAATKTINELVELELLSGLYPSTSLRVSVSRIPLTIPSHESF